jgi:hypothetical protein
MIITISTHELRELLEQIQGQTKKRKTRYQPYKILVEPNKFKNKRNGNGNGWKSDRN